MVEPILPRHHRILIGAEIAQRGQDEVLERHRAWAAVNGSANLSSRPKWSLNLSATSVITSPVTPSGVKRIGSG